jgi:putative FmdB family regulatory protein
MPLYDYHCQECDRTFEVSATFKQKQAGLQPSCPSCNSKETEQLIRVPLMLHAETTGDAPRMTGTCNPGSGAGCCGS